MDFAGKGNRRPQLDINVSIIELDNENPRLLPYLSNPKTATQFDLTKILYDNFETETVAMSLVENGYFDEEPIIVVPKNIPEGLSFEAYKTPEELAKAIQELITAGKISFVVLEGNRRISSIKMIIDSELRNQLNIDKIYPKTDSNEKLYDISNIPCIIYENRADVSIYLGVRHIAGLLKWEAFAQAAYTATVIQQEIKTGKTIDEAVKKVQTVVGDRSDKIKKQFISYQLFLQARDDINFNVRPIINKFSLLTVAYNSASIREYMGVEPYSKVDLSKSIVSTENLEKFEDILTWIYGNKNTSVSPVLTDSRQITNTLSHVVRSERAIEVLKETKDLELAYERTNGEKEYLIKKLSDGFKSIQISLQFAYKFKGDEALLKQVTELHDLVDVLKKNLL